MLLSTTFLLFISFSLLQALQMQHFSDSRWWARIANQLLNAVSYGSVLYVALLKKPRNGLGGLWGLVLTLGTVVGTGTAPGPRVTKHTSGKRLWVVWGLRCLCKSTALLFCSKAEANTAQEMLLPWSDAAKHLAWGTWCGPGLRLPGKRREFLLVVSRAENLAASDFLIYLCRLSPSFPLQ